jgi:hypothetical protein
MNFTTDRFARHLFFASVALLLFAYGMVVQRFKIFPYQVVRTASSGYAELCQRCPIWLPGKTPSWYYMHARHPHLPAILNTDQAYQGLNLVAEVASKRQLSAKIINMEGKTIHCWDVDWFHIWPGADHLPVRAMPKSLPGTHVHGTMLMDSGDLLFNYDRLGLVRLSREGKVVWRLRYQTHHSIERDDDGNFWVCGQKDHAKPSARFPNQVPPFIEYTILVVTPGGKIIRQWSIADLLRKNGYAGLLYLGCLKERSTMVHGDVLHLNDAEPFPAHLKEAFFRKGDVLVSLRNANTVFVFHRYTDKISYISTGQFVRQHDPDFIDGNTFSVFDNNRAAPEQRHPQSRIAIVSAPDNKVTTFFQGTPKQPFYTPIMGKHQWLPNGNLLITESCEGRAFEINASGKIVWQYINFVGDGMVGLVDEVQRLPLRYARFFGASDAGPPITHLQGPVPKGRPKSG